MDGEPLFAGDSDLDQLYRILAMLGPLTPHQQRLFSANPHNAGVSFNLKKPESLASRCAVCVCVGGGECGGAGLGARSAGRGVWRGAGC